MNEAKIKPDHSDKQLDIEADTSINGSNKWNPEKALRMSQQSALNKCGYVDLSRCTDQQLRDFIQAESLNSIVTIKKIAIFFTVITCIGLVVSWILQ